MDIDMTALTEGENVRGPELLAEAEARLEAAIAGAQKGAVDSARGVARHEVSAFPRELRILHRAGVVFRLCGDYREALTLFERALAGTPRFHYTEIEIGNVHTALNDPDDALRWYRLAIEHRPDYPAGYLHAARLEQARGRTSEALAFLNRLHERVPNHEEGQKLHEELGRVRDERPTVAPKKQDIHLAQPKTFVGSIRAWMKPK